MSTENWMAGLTIGRGFNPSTSEMFQQAVEFKDPTPALATQGQNVVMKLKVVNTASELAKELNVSASASLSVELQGSGSAEASFLSSTTMNSSYTYALVTVSITNAPLTIKNPVLKPEASEILSNNGWDAFYSSYGSEWIETIIPGGFFYGLIEVKTSDASQKDEAASSLSGSYDNFGVSVAAKADATAKLQNSLKSYEKTVTCIESGGSGEILPTTLDGMIEAATKFTARVAQNPDVLRIVTNTYKRSVPLPKSIPSDDFNFTPQKQKIGELGKRYLALKQYRDSLNFAIQKWDAIDKSDYHQTKQALQDSLKAAEKESDAIFALARQCSDDANQCSIELPAPLEFLSLPEGKIVNLKEMEDTIKQLRSELDALQPELNVLKALRAGNIQFRARIGKKNVGLLTVGGTSQHGTEESTLTIAVQAPPTMGGQDF